MIPSRYESRYSFLIHSPIWGRWMMKSMKSWSPQGALLLVFILKKSMGRATSDQVVETREHAERVCLSSSGSNVPRICLNTSMGRSPKHEPSRAEAIWMLAFVNTACQANRESQITILLTDMPLVCNTSFPFTRRRWKWRGVCYDSVWAKIKQAQFTARDSAPSYAADTSSDKRMQDSEDRRNTVRRH